MFVSYVSNIEINNKKILKVISNEIGTLEIAL